MTLKLGETAWSFYEAHQSCPTADCRAAPPSTSRRDSPAPISTRSNASASPTRRCSRAKRLDMPVVFYVDPAIVEVTET